MLTLFCLKVFPGNKFLNWKPPWELLTLIGFTIKHENILHLIDRTNRFEFGGFSLLMTKKKGHQYFWGWTYDSWEIKCFSHYTTHYTLHTLYTNSWQSMLFLQFAENFCYLFDCRSIFCINGKVKDVPQETS